MGWIFDRWERLNGRQRAVAGFALVWFATFALDHAAEFLLGLFPSLVGAVAVMSYVGQFLLNGYVLAFLAGGLFFVFWPNIVAPLKRTKWKRQEVIFFAITGSMAAFSLFYLIPTSTLDLIKETRLLNDIAKTLNAVDRAPIHLQSAAHLVVKQRDDIAAALARLCATYSDPRPNDCRFAPTPPRAK